MIQPFIKIRKRKETMFYEDTIAGIATSSQNGSISVIRVSGEKAVEKVSQIFCNRSHESIDLTNKESHTIHYGFIYDEEQLIDEVMVLLMLSPRSYTTEDVVEIQCHGGFLICQLVFKTLMKQGIRAAEPGEFTKRAFLNGRLDLSQAESVMDVIQAESRLALGNSMSQLRGRIKENIMKMRETLLTDTAYLEAALDDPEHISLDDFPSVLRPHVEALQKEIAHLLKNGENGRLIKEGIKTVIVGKPNVGKSSFMNCILREERAIVTDIPGTTRDTLEEDLKIGSTKLRLIDTAGIHTTEDKVENIGIKKAEQSLEEADMIILVLDAGSGLEEEDLQILEKCRKKPGVILLNKSDLDPVISCKEIERNKELSENKKIISFSSKTGDGMEELEKAIEDMVFKEKIDYNSEIYITNMRQKQALMDAGQSLNRVMDSIDMGMPEDLYTIDLCDAYESLGKIIGETVEEDIIEKIFHDFCMGK